MLTTTELEKPAIEEKGCRICRAGQNLGFDFTMAFQPIVDIAAGVVYAHEALVRGVNGEGAGHILGQVDHRNRYAFDQACRVTAVRLAAQLGVTTNLSINFLPGAVYRPEVCIRSTIEAAETYGFPLDRITFEVTEGEQVVDGEHLKRIIDHYRSAGLRTAIDDFGAGYSGLNLLARFQPDVIKLDMALVRDIDSVKARQAIVRGVFQVCRDLDITIVAEGVETAAERDTLADIGIHLIQGFYYARPVFEGIAELSAADIRR